MRPPYPGPLADGTVFSALGGESAVEEKYVYKPVGANVDNPRYHTAGICRRWDVNGFIRHKLGFNVDLSYGTCCNFDLYSYKKRNLL